MNIFIVRGINSDRTSWIVGAYKTRGSAEKIIDKARIGDNVPYVIDVVQLEE